MLLFTVAAISVVIASLLMCGWLIAAVQRLLGLHSGKGKDWMFEMAEEDDECADGFETKQQRMVGGSVQDTQRSYGVGNGGGRRQSLRRRSSLQSEFDHVLLRI